MTTSRTTGTRSSHHDQPGLYRGRTSTTLPRSGAGRPAHASPSADLVTVNNAAEAVLGLVLVQLRSDGALDGHRGSATAMSRVRPKGRPHREAEEDRPSGSGHPHHLVGHPPRARDVLEHVGGVQMSKLSSANGSCMPSPITVPAPIVADDRRAHRRRRRGRSTSPPRLERVAEVAGSAADVEHGGPTQRREAVQPGRRSRAASAV